MLEGTIIHEGGQHWFFRLDDGEQYALHHPLLLPEHHGRKAIGYYTGVHDVENMGIVKIISLF